MSFSYLFRYARTISVSCFTFMLITGLFLSIRLETAGIIGEILTFSFFSYFYPRFFLAFYTLRIVTKIALLTCSTISSLSYVYINIALRFLSSFSSLIIVFISYLSIVDAKFYRVLTLYFWKRRLIAGIIES